MPAMDNDWGLVADIASSVRSGRVSAISLVNKSFELIEKNKSYQTIIAVLKKEAVMRAKMIDRAVAKNEDPGLLAGVPFIAKDNFLVAGADTTAASNMLVGFNPPYQSSVINRLEAAGAICVAKANLDAFAHGASTENSDFFVSKNPYDQNRVPGGSSGGSAAAVALQLAPFALGSDTGGSIRQPASFCGLFGLKPTYGLVSRSGVVAMGSSLDCIGPLCSNVTDAALILDVISGKDELDSTTIDKDRSGYSKGLKPAPLKGMKIGLIKEYMGEGIQTEVKQAVVSTVDKLKKSGAIVSEISLPSLPLALACYYIICPAEVSSNLSRYDGVRYGFSADEATNLEESYLLSRGRGFGMEAKRRIMIGTYVLSSGYYDAYYRKAQTVRTKIINDFNRAFADVDLLIGPVAPTTAFKIGSKNQDPLAMYLSDVMTVAASLAGIPAASLPIDKDNDGLPIGLQLMTSQRQDKRLLSAALSIESMTGYSL
jgi:aspartyl-tRNA(Asn)/glutamyl-tRNA(Gln) amidotransferase subunit A